LDESLIEWRDNLPYHLRFDQSHVLESEVNFRRQRNYLAIKYHHIRTIIYRPYLCWQRTVQLASLEPVDREFCVLAEYVCIAEAQAMARLVEKTVDKQTLLRDFPWWQMISCLMCAGSILMIAGIVNPEVHDFAVICSDAQTFYKVFKTLGETSEVARRCASIMRDLDTRLNSSQGKFL